MPPFSALSSLQALRRPPNAWLSLASLNRYHSPNTTMVNPRFYRTSVKDTPPTLLPSTRQLALTSDSYQTLSLNRYSRFMPNSPIIGHAVLRVNGEDIIANQYTLPEKVDNAPHWQPLVNIKPIKRFGSLAYQAETTWGQTLFSTKGYRFTDSDQNLFELRPFHLPPEYKAEPFWGNPALLHITKEPVTDIPEVIKGGQEIIIEPDSVYSRHINKQRLRSQNQTMGETAKNAYQSMLPTWQHRFTPQMNFVFSRAINANRKHPFWKKFSLEWLHAVAHSLISVQEDPQVVSNIGSGPHWANTEMLVFEALCQWIALNHPEITTQIRPSMYMLFGSELIDKIDYELQLTYRNRFLRFNHHIEVLRQMYPTFTQASDIAQMAGISLAMLSNTSPLTETILGRNDVYMPSSLKAISSIKPDQVKDKEPIVKVSGQGMYSHKPTQKESSSNENNHIIGPLKK